MKKIICAILLFAMMFQLSVYAQGNKIIGNEQKNDLYEYGIMVGDGNGNFRLGDNITRAEAVKMLCVTGHIAKVFEGKNIFSDIDENHWAFDYIVSASENGIVNGDENGRFNPDKYVKNEELVKMIVCLLGYGERANLNGGYPAGYTAQASAIGVTKDLKLAVNGYATRNDAAIMISNALDIPIVKENYNEEFGGFDYILMDGKNGVPMITLRDAFTLEKYDTSLNNINSKAQEFASKYEYREGDSEKSFELYPGILYTSGLEKTADGMIYECPAIYDDAMANEKLQNMTKGKASLYYNDNEQQVLYALYDFNLLIPAEVLETAGCSVKVDETAYVAEISDGKTVLEILPNVIGMRKNKADGYWVPLKICARIIDDMFYVPAEAVLNEFGLQTKWNETEKVIEISSAGE